MGLVHTPRVVAAIARGYLQGRSTRFGGNGSVKSSGGGGGWLGLGPRSEHVYHARVNLFDVDYLGHMNNAAYLSHAELARWELTAANGMLGSMVRHGISFVVAGAAVRYRRDIRPVLAKFQVHSYVAGLDERNLWIYQTFRCSSSGSDSGQATAAARIRAQVLVQGVALQGSTVLAPREYFVEKLGVDPALVDPLLITPTATTTTTTTRTNNSDTVGDDDENDNGETRVIPKSMEAMIDRYEQMEAAFRASAAEDDQRLSSNPKPNHNKDNIY